MSFVFDPAQPVSRNLSREAAAQLRAALDIARAADMPAARRIRDARTCCKRVRGLLRLVGPAFPACRGENAAVRDAARGLSGARDADTMQETLGGLGGQGKTFSAAELGRLHAAVAQSGRPDAVADDQALTTFVAAIEPIYVRALLWHAESLDWQDVAAGAEETYRRARRAMTRAAEMLAPADFHEWRKEAKYHWYHLRLLRRFDADRFRPARDGAKHLAQLLGTHHDLEVLASRVGAAMAGDRALAARLGRAVSKRQDAIAADALTVGADLFGAKPGAWRKALETRITAAAAGVQSG